MARSRNPNSVLGDLDVKSVSRLVSAASDIVLVLDDQGTVVEVLTQHEELVQHGAPGWQGRPWAQTVTTESRQKVEALLRDAKGAVESRWRQVNHPGKDGEVMPLLYSATRVTSAGAGASYVVAFGRNLSETMAIQRRLIEAQQSMERDYWRYREAETRYRHLFETSVEAVLVLDGSTLRVLEANPAARKLCGDRRARLVGTTFASLFLPGHGERLQNLVSAARTVGRQEALRAQLADEGPEVTVSASVFRQNDAAFVLVRMAPGQGDRAESRSAKSEAAGARQPRASDSPATADAFLQAYLRQSPDAIVFCDPQGRVLSANAAFVSLAQLSAEEQVRGQALDRWVGRTGVELGVLMTTLVQRGSVGLFVTLLRGEYGAAVEVEIAAAVLSVAGESVLAFALRDIERRTASESKSAVSPMGRSDAELAELVGRTPLKTIVSETTDVIEQLCIQTALNMTGDNRASAAVLLGLSRQSLYVKLRRYGMVSSSGEDEADL
jgi:transcriptional regulator PpsR